MPLCDNTQYFTLLNFRLDYMIASTWNQMEVFMFLSDGPREPRLKTEDPKCHLFDQYYPYDIMMY